MINKIHLKDFRNFDEKLISFSPKITVIVGPNASGKTNILESVFLLSTGKSFKAKIEEEMVRSTEELARVKASISDIKLEVVLTKGSLKAVTKKKLLVNGVPKRMIDFAKNFHVVLFAPQDMDFVTESPSVRRRFLDIALSQSDYEYRRSLLVYEKGLRQRNRILQKIRDEQVPRTQLFYWDNLLLKNGDYISNARENFINYINQTPSFSSKKYEIEYDKSAISPQRLEQYKMEEVAAGTTLVGPHRDDFIFKEESRDLSSYGSRGEQRMAVLWLKLAELRYLEEILKERPTLLLDYIFSELDHEHRDIVMEIADNQQTIITTADPHFIQEISSLEKIELGE
ncbi:DNA replication and repair protein RecF [Candidatus Microgenomates bacterium]|nr:DNA replication and repair protein RecF [Candidatus Microgenomates bacterium]